MSQPPTSLLTSSSFRQVKKRNKWTREKLILAVKMLQGEEPVIKISKLLGMCKASIYHLALKMNELPDDANELSDEEDIISRLLLKRGPKASPNTELQNKVLTLLADNPAFTAKEIIDRLPVHMKKSTSTIYAIIKKMNFTKKRHSGKMMKIFVKPNPHTGKQEVIANGYPIDKTSFPNSLPTSSAHSVKKESQPQPARAVSLEHQSQFVPNGGPCSPSLSCTTNISNLNLEELRMDRGNQSIGTGASIIDPTSSKLYDPNCDPDAPLKVNYEEVVVARAIIGDSVDKTPCKKSRLSAICNMEIWFKKDFLQYTGSFKERGASHSLLKLIAHRDQCLKLSGDKMKMPNNFCHDPRYPTNFEGVIAASAGNHALALAYHGQLNRIPVTVVMPKYAPIMKVNSCKTFNAKVIVRGNDMAEAKQYALYLSKLQNLVYINGYDHPDIISGQGTMGLEICEQLPQFDAIIIPVGGGGLIAGVATVIKKLRPETLIIGVEAVKCPSFTNGLKEGKPIYTPSYSTLADGLAVPVVGVNAFETAKDLVDKIVTVNEEHIALAILRLLEMEKAVVEGAGACGLGAVLGGLLPELTGKRVVILLCGGNIDTSILGRCIDRGLAADGRLIRFKVTLLDRPGGIAQLTNYLCSLGVSLKDIFHERAWVKNDIFSVDVKCVAETRDWEHTFELKDGLKQKYPNARFEDLEDKMIGFNNRSMVTNSPCMKTPGAS